MAAVLEEAGRVGSCLGLLAAASSMTPDYQEFELTFVGDPDAASVQ
jgi:hypothetical protein